MPTRIPHRVEAAIINLHQRSRRDVLPQVKAERFEKFQASRSIPMCPFNRLPLKLRIIRLLESRIRRLGESIKATRIGLVVFRDSLFQTIIVSAGQVDHSANIPAVHYRKQFLRSA